MPLTFTCFIQVICLTSIFVSDERVRESVNKILNSKRTWGDIVGDGLIQNSQLWMLSLSFGGGSSRFVFSL